MVIKTLLSSIDPITEQEDGCSLDEENERFSRNLLDKTYSNKHAPLKNAKSCPFLGTNFAKLYKSCTRVSP